MTVSTGISPYAKANPFFRAMRQMAGYRPVSWVYARTLATDRFVSRITGRHMTFVSLATGLQAMLLTDDRRQDRRQRTQRYFTYARATTSL